MVAIAETFVPDAAEWAKRQWDAVDVGDARLERRVVEVGTQMTLSPGASIAQQMRDRAELKAAYRLLDNSEVSYAALSEPHWLATRREASRKALVLLVQDQTELDLTHYVHTMVELGPIGNGRGVGLLLHTTLAVIPTPRQVLGIAYQQVFKRVPTSEVGPRWRRPKEERETRVWGKGVEAIGSPPQGSRWVVVTDRAGDNTDFLLTCRRTGVDFTIRLGQEHRLVTEDGETAYLLTSARDWPAVVGKTLEVKERGGRKGRQAHLLLSFGQVTLRVPKAEEPLHLWAVRVWEVDAPAGVEPVEWILGTSVAVETAEEALERTAWYTTRWLAEEYHQCLKTGCAVEHRDLEHADRLERLIGFLAPIAVRLLQLQEDSRLRPDLPASAVADPLAVTLLAAKLNIPVTTMTVRAFWRGVAQLGGFLGRRRDGQPGWKTLWRGWLYLDFLVEGARLSASLYAT